MVEEDSGSFAGDTVTFHHVTDRDQARLLADPVSQRFFRPFLARETTATAAVTELGSDLDRVLYRIRTFLAAGLLSVVRELPRPGRAIKVYRSVHDAYLIPYELTAYGTLEERLWEQAAVDLRERVRLQARRMAERGWSGQRLFRNDKGEVWAASAQEDGAVMGGSPQDPGATVWPAGNDFWTDLYLTSDEAAGLQRRLTEELVRFEGRRQTSDIEGLPPRRRYRFSVALVPIEG